MGLIEVREGAFVGQASATMHNGDETYRSAEDAGGCRYERVRLSSALFSSLDHSSLWAKNNVSLVGLETLKGADY